MKPDRELILKLEGLGMLRLSEPERTEAEEKLGEIISYCEQLCALDAEAPSVPEGDVSVCPLRRDMPAVKKEPDKLLKNAAEIINGCFSVPEALGEAKE